MGLRRLIARTRAAFGGGRLDRELDAEIRAHLEMAADEYARRGLTPDEARAAAVRAFGAVEPMKERYRDTRGLPALDVLRQDARYAWRTLRKAPAVTSVVVLSLALAIGANTAVFSVINALTLRALPVRDAHALVNLSARGAGNQPAIISFPMYRDLRDRQDGLTDILATAGETAVRLTIPDATGGAAELDNMRVSFVTGNYFDVMGVRPAVGRFFSPDEDRDPNTAETLGSVIVLSEAFWARQFGRDPGVVGRTVLVGRARCEVIGVAAPGFTGEAIGNSPIGWVPIVTFTSEDMLAERTGMFTASIGRLKPGVTRAQAEAALTTLFQQLLASEQRVRDDVGAYRLVLQPGGTGLDYGLRRTYARPLLMVMAIVATVLLVACTNVANLLLARAAARRGEIGVRLAIGCSRRRLVGQLLTESLLLSASGGAAGLLLAYWGSEALVRMVSSGPVPIDLDVGPDLRVLGFLLGVTVLTSLAFGLAPALRATRLDVAPVLKGSSRGDVAPRSRQRLSRALVTCQIALSLLLLVAAGLLIRSVQNLHQLDLGFNPERVLIFDLAARNREAAALSQAAWNVYARVKQVPGVESASLSGLVLFSPSDIRTSIDVPGYVAPSPGRLFARFNAVSPGYFETVGMTLVAGRGIEERDTLDRPLAVIVNESFARSYLAGSALGRTIKVGIPRMAVKAGEVVGPRMAVRAGEVVGVVRDAKYNNLRQATDPMIYLSILQAPRSLRSLEVRTRQPVSTIAGPLREAIASADRDVMIRRIVPLRDQVDHSLAAERLIMRLSSAFGALALLLAGIGLYGVMSYTVTQRTGEIGIRMALGATGAAVVWMVLRQTLRLVGAGVLLGVPLALAGARLLTGFLYGLTARDPATLALATTVLAGCAALAAYLPARRAARVNPIAALRCE